MAPPLPPPLQFQDTLGDYIPLVDPSSLPTYNFLPSIEALAMTDCRGRSRNILDGGTPLKSTMLNDEDVVDDNRVLSEGAADAILEEGIAMQRHIKKRVIAIVISLNSNSDDDWQIVFSVPGGSSFTCTRGNTCPLVHSMTSVVVKKEPKSPGAPSSPTLWGDCVSPEDALYSHDLYVKRAQSTRRR